MSMLARFRRQEDGFEQLLYLIESSTEAKQQNFLRLIEQEDAGWASLLRSKLLTIERIFRWEESTLRVIVGMMPNRLLIIALKDYGHEYLERVQALMTKSRQEDFFLELGGTDYSEAQRDSARATFLKKVRDLIRAGQIKLEYVDPALVYRNQAA